MIENGKIKIYDERAKEFAKNCQYTKATMQGVYHDLEKLKAELLKIYDPHIFWINYYKYDAPYMGWRFDDPQYKNMCNLTEDIKTKFLEMYILIEKGLGNNILTNEDNEDEQ